MLESDTEIGEPDNIQGLPTSKEPCNINKIIECDIIELLYSYKNDKL